MSDPSEQSEKALQYERWANSLTPPPPRGKEITPDRRIAWMRRQVIDYARDLCAQGRMSPQDFTANDEEITGAIEGFGRICHATPAEVNQTIEAVMREADGAAREFIDFLNRKIRYMVSDEDVTVTLLTVRNWQDRYRVFIPTDILDPYLRQTIAHQRKVAATRAARKKPPRRPR